MIDSMAGWQDALISLGLVIGAAVIGLLIHRIFYLIATRATLVEREWWGPAGTLNASMVHRSRRPAKLILPLVAMILVLPLVPVTDHVIDPLRHAIGLGLIGAFAWLIVAMVDVVGDMADARFRIDVEDNLTARRLRTQVHVLRRIAVIIVGVIALAAMLMTFQSIRRIGESLFASAGLAALIAGLAARPTLTSLIAGIQIALTEPIRLDDVVIVEGEYGRIEEIGSTYVIVRVWDQRRLVVPLNYFIEKPFQNWTRQSANILGTVYLYTDYSVPVEEIRSELHRILEKSDKWDGKVCGLQVTDSTAQVMELRALLSAPDSSVAWDLRCLVREELIRFVRERYPESLPRTRADVRNVATSRLQDPNPTPA
ncbi:MAG: mechanosensitive ion channel family protein [Nitrolancea sp.]